MSDAGQVPSQSSSGSGADDLFVRDKWDFSDRGTNYFKFVSHAGTVVAGRFSGDESVLQHHDLVQRLEQEVGPVPLAEMLLGSFEVDPSGRLVSIQEPYGREDPDLARQIRSWLDRNDGGVSD